MDALSEARRRIEAADKKIAELFSERMEAVREIAFYKAANDLPVEDAEREQLLLGVLSESIPDDGLKGYYIRLLEKELSLSKDYQRRLLAGNGGGSPCLYFQTEHEAYPVYMERGILSHLPAALIANAGKVLIVTDDGVPAEYPAAVQRQFPGASVVRLPRGEQSKSFEQYRKLLLTLTNGGFTRSDTVIAVGGGVVGDLAGFAAATYLRGLRFYNVPTTLLSQVDSSVGGKTAIDFQGYKNSVGAFYSPCAVVIDPEVLRTLPARQFSNGLAESIKMAATSDARLFELLEKNDAAAVIDEIILSSLKIKKEIVERDEKEAGLRRILNFGHTLGHALESCNAPSLLHGECVAVGMLPMCSESAFARLKALLEKNALLPRVNCPPEALADALTHDKKRSGEEIRVVYVEKIGSCRLQRMTVEQITRRLREVQGK